MDLIPKTWLPLSSGGYLDLLAPEPGMIRIRDIATGLANVSRFAGQLAWPKFYTVAEHSVHVSHLVPQEGRLPLLALLHDAPEAYLGDITAPLKGELPRYKEIEAVMEEAIHTGLGLAPFLDESHRKVKIADRLALALEQAQVLKNPDQWHFTQDVGPLPDYVIPCWSRKVARMHFLQRFNELWRGWQSTQPAPKLEPIR